MNEQGSTPSVGNPPSRSVGLDVPILDNDLIEMLLPTFQSAFQYMNYSDSTDKLLRLCTTHILKAIMIYSTNIRTPAMRHLSVKIKSENQMTKMGSEQHSNMQSIRIYKYIAMSCFLPLLLDLIKFKSSSLRSSLRIMSNNDEDHEIMVLRRRAAARQDWILQILLKTTALILPPLQLYHYITYLLQKQNRSSPSFSMNHNGLRYANTNATTTKQKRNINFSYAFRRMYFDELILTLGILPTDVWSSLPRNMQLFYRRALVQMKSMLPMTGRRSELAFSHLPIDDVRTTHACSICAMKPIVIPYKTSCGHVYCYACLRLAMSDNLNYKCAVCGRKVVSSEPI